ncbi:MAG: hypothetical protein Q8N00_02060 [Nitrospirota bacterium]|nr:hypothetical protein [Nitrospirota bacterium]MDP3595464.1 hypothetical protein [Nitrospirota bacterium]
MDQTFSLQSPVWKQPRGCYGSNYWTVYSPKLKRDVNLYSNLERDNWVLVESNPQIIWFCEAPVRIRIKIAGHDTQTIPDMFVRFRDGREEYQEIKYARDLERLEMNGQRTRQILGQETWCALAGANHRVVTDLVIRANPLYLTNWKCVLAHLASAARLNDVPERDNVISTIAGRSVWRLAELEQACFPLQPQMARLIVFQLLHQGEVVAPLDTCPLNGALEIRRMNGNPVAA